ncbi:sugar transferase [Parasediminibacterium paludis]|uniref:Sugar transferase n=1 Tax=Parasediminibacterium paludis TaxID=908966 RepID=A0ABV8PYF8_9BACT
MNLAETSTEIIAFINCDSTTKALFETYQLSGRKMMYFENGIELVNNWKKNKLQIVAIVSQSDVLSVNGISLLENLEKRQLLTTPFCLILPKEQLTEHKRKLALESGVAELFTTPLSAESIETRLNFLITNWSKISNKQQHKAFAPYKTEFLKRAFDLLFAGTALICLSPLFLIIYLWIKLESKGPAFYYALRVGTGYRVFKFYKFRSMYADADKRLKDLKHLNQYAANKEVVEDIPIADDLDVRCAECKAADIACRFPIYADNIQWCEQSYIENKSSKANSAFFKLKNDPRITKVGKFIRNTSIDELPQLWNVIIGDMSIVGNRPLPLYEAEKLTSDRYALRFLAPAGITGLWQVEKRGKGEMSEDERLMLDNKYAENHSFVNDIRLILKTIPALFQSENV